MGVAYWLLPRFGFAAPPPRLATWQPWLYGGGHSLASIEKPARNDVRRLTAVALVITMALAALGIATPGTRLPAVMLANLVGGYLLLALFAATLGVTMAARDGSMPRRASLRLLALVVLALGLVQAAAGGLIGAQFALTACPTLVSCPDYPYGQFLTSPAFDPFRSLSIVDGRVVLSPRAAGVHVVHRELGIIVLAFTLIVAVALRRHMPSRAARSPCSLWPRPSWALPRSWRCRRFL